MKLNSYWRSSSAFRVRIALNLKGLKAEYIPIHLVKDGGEQLKSQYMKINPAGRIPALVTDNGEVLTQSLAIINYLEEMYPTPSLLPADTVTRAHVRAFAETIACDIQPIQNLGVLKFLKNEGEFTDDQIGYWSRHWIARGFAALEEMLAESDWNGPFAYGDKPTLAEVCLVPQFFNARRFSVDLTPYPRLVSIEEAARALPAFFDAAPGNQPDAE